LGARLLRVGRLTQREVAAVFVQLGRAITRAHDAGIIHRDLKVGSPHAVVAPAAPMEEPKAVSVESIPTAAPTENPRLVVAKPQTPTVQSAAKLPAITPKIILEETPNDNSAALPENPYKSGSGSRASPPANNPGF
jgi:serine/threonine protein kinase